MVKVRFPRGYAFRGFALIVLLGIVYLAVAHGIRTVTYGRPEDYRVLMATFIMGLILLSGMTSYLWLRFWAPRRPELETEAFRRAELMLQELAGISGLQVELRVIDAKRVFIYSAGITNRMVIISTGALEGLSEEALRGVLAHELAHMILRHAMKNLCALSAFFGIRIAFALGGMVGLAMLMWLLLYLRTNEYEADRVAVVMVGKSPMLLALSEVKALTRMREFSRITEFLIATHPSYERRAEAITGGLY